MKIEPRCYPCQIKRVLSELKLCNLESEKELEIAQKMVGFYGTTKERRSSWLGTSARSLLANLTGIQDPYEELKRQANEFAIEELEKFREFLDAISDPFERFEKACLGSVIGNQMEFFLMEHDFELRFPQPLTRMLAAQKFSKNDLPKSYKILERSENVLFLTDNAGEIAFDRVLIENLLQLFPKIEVTVSVKPKPIINDATMKDAQTVGLKEMERVNVITTGINSIGLFLQEVSPEFKRIWDHSDLIIKKGMGHAETRDALGETPPCPVLYLLRVKCTTVGNKLDAKLKQNIALLDEF